MHYGRVISWLRNQTELYPLGEEYLALLDLEKNGGERFILADHPHLIPVYRWIDRNFMVTIVGCYFGEEGVLVFQRGDGGYIIGDQSGDTYHTETYNDFPPYLAYSLIPEQKMLENLTAVNTERAALGKQLLPSLPDTAYTGGFFEANRVAIFTDGLTTDGKPMPDVFKDNQVWERLDNPHLWNVRKSRLRNWVRIAWKEGKITDDACLMAFARR
jgi:hypothetical protein